MAFFTMAGSTLANLFKKPATRPYPEQPREYFALTRGQVVNAIDQCSFCGLCRRKCPTTAIRVERESRIWEIERLQCIACGNCCEACPKQCLSLNNHYAPPITAAEKGTTRIVMQGS